MASVKANVNRDGEIISYRVRVCLGRDDLYRQIWKTCTLPRPEGLTPGRERREIARLAAEWERQQRELFQRGGSADRDRITLKAFVWEHWIPDHVRNGRHTPNGERFFERMARIVTDHFGDRLRLSELDAERIKRFVNWIGADGRYAPSTQKHVLDALRNVLRYAVRIGYLDRDPAERLTAADLPVVPPPTVDFMDPAEARTFLSVLDREAPLRWRVFFRVLLFAGLRRGEALGIQWRDLDSEARTLTVRRNVTPPSEADRAAGRTAHVGATKTGTVREVPIVDTLCDLLTEWREEAVRRYGAVEPGAFIFGRDEDPSRPMAPSSPTSWLRRFERRHGLRDLSPHDLRHSAASLALEGGADLKQIQAVLGHSNASVTLRFYVGLTQERTRRAVEGIESIVLNARTPQDAPED